MNSISTMPARTLQKSYRSIIEGVSKKNSAVILTIYDKPRAVIVSLTDFEELKLAKAKKASYAIFAMATEFSEELKGLPADLRVKADEAIYSK